MGYESRLYIVNKSGFKPFKDDNGKIWAEKIAEFNLCKVYGFSDWFNKQPETDCFIYADDGNTHIIEDVYENPLKEASIEDVINQLDICMKTGDYYRRYYPIYSLLKAFREHINEWENLVVLHYGY